MKNLVRRHAGIIHERDVDMADTAVSGRGEAAEKRLIRQKTWKSTAQRDSLTALLADLNDLFRLLKVPIQEVKMHRMYSNEDITVFWNSEKCRHAGKCVTGNPEVFVFGRRPWIDLSRGQSAQVWQTVSKCPTGALTLVYNHGVTVRLMRMPSGARLLTARK